MDRIPRLVLLNGPPAIGKSTCARRWVAGRQAALVVEVDELRTSIAGWQHSDRTKLEARRMAIALIDHHLRGGSDVMVPQYLGRIEFIVELERTAKAAGAEFVEILLAAHSSEIVARFDARRAEGTLHPEHEVEDVCGAVADAIARLELIARERPNAATVAAHDDPDVTLARVTSILDG